MKILDSNKTTINIVGSCVSREIFNFTNDFKVQTYIFHNPIHTMFSDKLVVDLETINSVTKDIDINRFDKSEFMKRVTYYEFNKLALDVLFAQKSNYLMIDFADLRFGYYFLKSNPNVKIAKTWHIVSFFDKILEKINCNLEWAVKQVRNMTFAEWDICFNQFVDKILNYYSVDQIIFNKVSFAKSYIDGDGKIVNYQKNNAILELEIYIKMLENLMLSKLKGCIVLECSENYLSSVTHKFEHTPYHYIDENYIKEVTMLKNAIK